MRPAGKLSGSLIAPPVQAADGRFLDAAMAAAALIANAGGGGAVVDRRALFKILDGFVELKAFDAHLAINSFHDFDHGITRRGRVGRAQALKAVSEVADNADAAKLIVRIGRTLAGAAGGPSSESRELVDLISAAAGVGPSGTAGEAPDIGGVGGPRPRVITLAAPKGGTGKSTAAVHLAAALVHLGHRVGSIDLDAGQGTMSRYLAHRASMEQETGQALGAPRHRGIEASRQRDRRAAEAEEATRLRQALADMADCRYVVVDTPGSDCHLARIGCCAADTLIMPLNDSLLDVDILARIDRSRRSVIGPSEFCRMIWRENDDRVAQDRQSIDWIVMRNRLAHIGGHNNREVAGLLRQLARRIGFRLACGLSERTVFRELFLKGLTVLDDGAFPSERNTPKSHIYARREIDDLLAAVGCETDRIGSSLQHRPAPARCRQ
jgi:chromosome partitioning protein